MSDDDDSRGVDIKVYDTREKKGEEEEEEGISFQELASLVQVEEALLSEDESLSLFLSLSLPLSHLLGLTWS